MFLATIWFIVDYLEGRLGNVHAACLRALHYSGTPDLVPLLMPFVQEPGPRAEAAKHTVWMICKRSGAPLPPDLPPVRVR